MKRALASLAFVLSLTAARGGRAQGATTEGTAAPMTSQTSQFPAQGVSPRSEPLSEDAEPASEHSPSPSLLPASILGGLGLIGLGVGTTMGILALNEKAETEDHCSTSQRLCDSTGAEASRKGRTYSAISLASFAMGGVLLGTSIWLFKSGQRQAQIAAFTSPSLTRLIFTAQF
jgi:hypothetical protein